MELVHFYLKMVIDDLELVSSYKNHKTVPIDLTYNFSNNNTPSDTEATIGGLTKETAEKIKVKSAIDIYAGFYNSDWSANNVAHTLSAHLTGVQPLVNDSGDWSMKINVQDGSSKSPSKAIKVKSSKKVRVKSTNKSTSYRSKIGAFEKQQRSIREKWLKANSKASRKEKHAYYTKMQDRIKKYRTELKGNQNRANKKANKEKTYRKKTVYKYMSFKPKTKGSAIIKKIAAKAGIKISEMKLVYDRVYYNGYTARKKPLNCIRDIAQDCQTDMFYQHGKLVIKSFAQNKRINYECVPETGLLTPPSISDDSDNKDTYQCTILFNPRVTVGSIFHITDNPEMSGFDDDIIVTSGSASISAGDTPTMDITFKKLSAYKKSQKAALKKKQSADSKSRAKRDKYEQKKAKEKRQKRLKDKKGKENKKKGSDKK